MLKNAPLIWISALLLVFSLTGIAGGADEDPGPVEEPDTAGDEEYARQLQYQFATGRPIDPHDRGFPAHLILPSAAGTGYAPRYIAPSADGRGFPAHLVLPPAGAPRAPSPRYRAPSPVRRAAAAPSTAGDAEYARQLQYQLATGRPMDPYGRGFPADLILPPAGGAGVAPQYRAPSPVRRVVAAPDTSGDEYYARELQYELATGRRIDPHGRGFPPQLVLPSATGSGALVCSWRP